MSVIYDRFRRHASYASLYCINGEIRMVKVISVDLNERSPGIGCAMLVELFLIRMPKHKNILICFLFHRIVKRSSPNLNNLTLVGCLLLYCTVFLENAENQSVGIVCKVHRLYLRVLLGVRGKYSPGFPPKKKTQLISDANITYNRNVLSVLLNKHKKQTKNKNKIINIMDRCKANIVTSPSL